MSKILVDSSIWIAFFKGTIAKEPFFNLIDTNQLSTNDLILSEIVPPLVVKNEKALIEILFRIERYPLRIDWSALIDLQTKNLRKGINNVGVPDLIILQNAIQNDLLLYTIDSHFKLMTKLFPLKMYV
jgi:predicted nucleic acid-binding protein